MVMHAIVLEKENGKYKRVATKEDIQKLKVWVLGGVLGGVLCGSLIGWAIIAGLAIILFKTFTG